MKKQLWVCVLGGCGGAGGGKDEAWLNEIVGLTAVQMTKDGPQIQELEVPRSFVYGMFPRSALQEKAQPGLLEEGLVSQGSVPCGSSAVWMADASFDHYTCANYDGVSSTGTCGDLDSWPRFYVPPRHYYWGAAVKYWFSGSWAGCWTPNNDCTGSGIENFSADQYGSTCDPLSYSCHWQSADSTVSSAHGIYANSCPGIPQ